MEIQEQLNKIQEDIVEIKKLLLGRTKATIKVDWDDVFEGKSESI